MAWPLAPLARAADGTGARNASRPSTVEVRVPDTQSTVAETTALAAVVHALVAWLAERHEAGEALAPAPTWRIGENRWSACRHGLDGTMADLITGEVAPTRERAAALLEELAGAADRVGCAAELALASNGLPLGLQLAAPAGEDDRLLAVAAWCESCFGFKGLV